MEQIYNAPHVKVKVVDVSVFRKKHYKRRNPPFKNSITETVPYCTPTEKWSPRKYGLRVTLSISSNECAIIVTRKNHIDTCFRTLQIQDLGCITFGNKHNEYSKISSGFWSVVTLGKNPRMCYSLSYSPIVQ